jgi:tellurite resistance protein
MNPEPQAVSGGSAKAVVPLIPAAFFGMVLGLAGLGTAWRAAAVIWPVPAVIGEILSLVAVVVWAVLITLYGAKWVFNRPEAIAEAEHPVQCCFIGLVGVSTMLAGLAMLPYLVLMATILFCVGSAFTLLFALWRTGGLWHGGRDPAMTTAVLYLPTVAGSFVTTAGASALGFPDWGLLAFGAGFLSWLAIESVLLHRLLTGPELAQPLRPTIAIQLAPPAVGSVAYLSVTTGVPDIFVHAMIGYGLLQALLLLRLLPWILKQPFAASYWASTFGATALATACIRMAGRGDVGAIAQLAPYVFVAANIVVIVIALGTLWLVARGRLLPVGAAVKQT